MGQFEESWEEGSLAGVQVSNIRNVGKKHIYLKKMRPKWRSYKKEDWAWN